jgi:hypothetical protein
MYNAGGKAGNGIKTAEEEHDRKLLEHYGIEIIQ